jgi:8-oxo-dGTP pyrophosphatase MutT (NUDIX family)
LTLAVDEVELAELSARWGDFARQHVSLPVSHPFLTGINQVLTARGRRAEVCYVMHRGDPDMGVLLHIKTFYPADAYRLPTGGIQQGEAVEATLAREIHEETGLTVGEAVHQVRVERFLGVVSYSLQHTSLGPTPFATYHFLAQMPEGAQVQPIDADEQILGWRWVSAGQLRAVADQLEQVADRPPPDGETWADWGRFRAISHRFVAGVLGK